MYILVYVYARLKSEQEPQQRTRKEGARRAEAEGDPAADH
jgi:hypothetical protein